MSTPPPVSSSVSLHLPSVVIEHGYTQPVMVCCCRFPVDQLLFHALASVCSPAEHERAGRYRRDIDRQRCLIGRGLMRHVLATLADRDPALITVAVTEHGKPRPLAVDQWEVNISHAGDWVVVATRRSGAIGVDVECRSRHAMTSVNLIDLVASPAERERITKAADADWAFLQIWVGTEALLKCLGIGLCNDLPAIDTCSARFNIPCRGNVPPVDNIFLFRTALDRDHALAVASVHRFQSISLHHVDHCRSWPLRQRA